MFATRLWRRFTSGKAAGPKIAIPPRFGTYDGEFDGAERQLWDEYYSALRKERDDIEASTTNGEEDDDNEGMMTFERSCITLERTPEFAAKEEVDRQCEEFRAQYQLLGREGELVQYEFDLDEGRWRVGAIVEAEDVGEELDSGYGGSPSMPATPMLDGKDGFEGVVEDVEGVDLAEEGTDGVVGLGIEMLEMPDVRPVDRADDHGVQAEPLEPSDSALIEEQATLECPPTRLCEYEIAPNATDDGPPSPRSPRALDPSLPHRANRERRWAGTLLEDGVIMGPDLLGEGWVQEGRRFSHRSTNLADKDRANSETPHAFAPTVPQHANRETTWPGTYLEKGVTMGPDLLGEGWTRRGRQFSHPSTREAGESGR